MTIKSKNGKIISTPEQLFNRHCIKGSVDECWPWGAYICPSGYGQTKVGGRASKLIQAHRLSWIVHFGEIPNGLHVLHKCDNRPCVNPNHLFLGTNQDNIADRVAKGRSQRWIATAPREKHPSTKILKTDLDEMIRLRDNKMKVVNIAKQFNICKEHCSKLITKSKKRRTILVFIGIDPGSVSGAVGALHPNGDYLDSFMIEHQDKHILPMVFKNMILRLVDPKEGAEICCELVHSMPNQGVASTFQFGRAVGVITAVCELTNYPLHMVRPQVWKKHFHLTSDKDEALDCARMLWPEAPLKRKKDINIAESLLIAEYWRDCINGKTRDKSA